MARRFNFPVQITANAWLYFALLVMIVPLPWLFSWIIAVFVHEISHCITLWILGKPVQQICVGNSGAKILTVPLTRFQAFLCALSGPAGGLLLVLAARNFPKLALCAFVQTVFNLLPVYPLDGGRALHAIADMLFPQYASRGICKWMEYAIYGLLLCFCGWMLFVWRLGMVPVALAAFLLANFVKIKKSCKDGLYAVQ